MRYKFVPTSTITAETVTVDGFTRSQKDTAGFLHGNSEKQFAYGYLSGSNLLQTLTMPNNMTLAQIYESQRDLLIGMAYHRGGTALVAQRTYTYDTLGRPLTRSTTRSGQATRSDSFSHNERSEVSAAIDAISGTFQWFLVWDPTQSIAARPLAIRKDGTWYVYGWDLTKNICEVYGQHGYIRSAYTYTPYGEVSASGDVEQPVQWSSEYTDTELPLVCYNYRHFNPKQGQWLAEILYAITKSMLKGNRLIQNENTQR